MAKHIKIGRPVNAAEQWAFSFLEKHLPANYILITNLEILAQSGQPLEVDALVIGQYAVYLVDVKGYIGKLEAGVNDWSLNGRWIDNSLSKANYVARVLAGRIREKVPRGVSPPWCQGMVFVTGQEGRSIEVIRDYEKLSVYGPDTIAEALTQPKCLTSKFQDEMTGPQRNYTLDVVGKIGVLASRQSRIHDFVKTNCLGDAGGVEIWEATYSVGDWSSDWLLKIVQVAKQECPSDFARLSNGLREEFYRLQQLSGASGIPTTATLISDGEQVVLPIKRPRGLPLSAVKLAETSDTQAIHILRSAVVALQQIHRRGCTVGKISESSVFVSEEGDIEVLDLRNNLAEPTDRKHFLNMLRPVAVATQNDEIIDWFRKVGEDAEIDEIRLILNRALTGDSYGAQEPVQIEIGEGAVISERYSLVRVLAEESNSQLWLAQHVTGQFECVVSFYQNAHENWPLVQEQLSRLMQLYHPSVERVFDVNVMASINTYYLARAWVPGEPLELAFQAGQPGQLRQWIISLLTAIQYLHAENILHRNITPMSIICDGENAVLINLSGLPDRAVVAEDLRYADSWVNDTGWTIESDLYSLFISILSLIRESEQTASTEVNESEQAWLSDQFGAHCAQAIQSFFSERPTLDPGISYLAHFKLDEDDGMATELPEEFSSEWAISRGYMTFLVLDMLNDRHARSRNQWVLNALRSRHIPGNKTNRGSMSATISRLKAAGIAEDHGKKIRLTETFISAWESRLVREESGC